MARPLKVLIAGGGIGGLTAAIACLMRGMDVTIFERTEQFQPVGAGLQLSANGLRVLDQLGVTELRKQATEIDHILVRDGVTGQHLSTIKIPNNPKSIVLSRADLHAALLARLHQIHGGALRMGAPVAKVQGNELILDDGNSEIGDVIIGADGVWSKVRPLIQNGKANFSGRITWRATLPIRDTPNGIACDTVGLWLGPNGHVLSYPIENGAKLNIVAIRQGDWLEESWSVSGQQAELQAHFASWSAPVNALLKAPEHWLKWALCSVTPNAPWQNGTTALLGDAAHGMVPFMAQGAAMCIEDGIVLAKALENATPADVPTALTSYERERKSRVQRVWNLSFQQGRIYHMGGPMRLVRNAAMRLAGGLIAKRYNWIYDWQPPSQRQNPVS